MTIVLFQVLGAFANRPLDSRLDGSEKDITVADVSSPPLLLLTLACAQGYCIYLVLCLCVCVCPPFVSVTAAALNFKLGHNSK